MGTLIYFNVKEIKTSQSNCITASNIDTTITADINKAIAAQKSKIINLKPVHKHTGGKKYTCADLTDQNGQIVPHVLWNDQYKNMVIDFINQNDSDSSISYLQTLENYTLYLLLQIYCPTKNMPVRECFGFHFSKLKNVPYSKWTNNDREIAIADLVTILDLDKTYFQKLTNKTLNELLTVVCSDF